MAPTSEEGPRVSTAEPGTGRSTGHGARIIPMPPDLA
jgi:hypothetical protein